MRILFVFSFLLTSFWGMAQKPLRIELDMSDFQTFSSRDFSQSVSQRTKDYHLVLAKEKGIFIYGFLAMEKDSEVKVRVDYYNVSFQKVWSKNIILSFERKSNRVSMESNFFSGTELIINFVLYSKRGAEKFVQASLDVVDGALNVKNIDLIQVKGCSLELNVYSSDQFSILNGFYNKKNNLFSSSNSKPLPAYTQVYDKKMSTPSVFDVDNKGNCIRYKMNFDAGNGAVDFPFMDYRTSTQGIFVDLEFNMKGNLVSKTEIDIPANFCLKSVKCFRPEKETKFILGIYSEINKTRNYKIDLAEGYYPKGFFVAKIVNGKCLFVKFNSFNSLKHFIDVASFSQQNIARKKRKADRNGEKLNLSLGTTLLLHKDVLVHKDGFIVTGETYTEEYHTEAYTTTVFVGGIAQPRTEYRTVFDGYRYNGLISIGFDNDGNILWDNGFKMGDTRRFQLEEQVTLRFENGEIFYMYSNNEEINFKVCNSKNEIESQESIEISTQNKDDKIRSTSNSFIKHWYQEYFILIGEQSIVNKEEDKGNRKRNVIFLTKVKVE